MLVAMHVALLPLIAVDAALADDAPRLPRDKLLVYRGDDGVAKTAATPADWLRRRADIVRGMESVMGELPGDERRCPLEVRVEEEVDCGSYVRRQITYASEPGSRVPAFLLIPKSALVNTDGKAQSPAKKLPAVLALHPTDNVVGNGVVVGLGGKENRQYAAELAERGFVVLAPSYPLLAGYQPKLAELGWKSGTLKAVWDNMRGLDLLDSLPYVRTGHYGVIGHSLGGHNGVFTAVLDERIRVVVSSCGLDAFVDYYGGREEVWQPEKGWTQTRYMPRLAEYRGRLAEIPFDFPELIAALAPRSVLIVAPTRDSNFQAASVDRVAAAARSVFKLHGHEDRLIVEHPDCDHDFPEAMRWKSYALLEKLRE